MSRTFTVTVPAETRTLSADRSGKADVTYTVTNTRAFPARAEVSVTPSDLTGTNWLSVAGSNVQDFRGSEAQQFKVQVAIPPQTPKGVYKFRLDAANVADKQEDFTEGDTVAVDWAGPPPVVVKKRKWLPIAIVVAVLALLGGGVAFWAMTRKATVPDLEGKTLAEAESMLKNASLGFDPTLVTEDFKEGKAEGRVIRQDPAKEQRVKKGTPVVIIIQEKRVQIPADAVGQPFANLQPKLAELKVASKFERQTGKLPGTVLGIAPGAGSWLAPGTEVTVTVQPAETTVTVPLGLETKPRAAVVQALATANVAFVINPVFETQRIPVPRPPGPPQFIEIPRALDSVIRLKRSGGAAITAGNNTMPAEERIILDVQGVKVPNIVGQPTCTAAANVLRQLGLVAQVSGLASAKPASQSPIENTVLLQGSPVVVQSSQRAFRSVDFHRSLQPERVRLPQ
jgi:beta-lactam-binding protein with PASTA domain